MDAFLLDGDALELSPDPPWSWSASPVRITVSGAHRIQVDGKSVVLEANVLAAATRALGQLYTAPGFDTPGSVASLVLTLSPGTLSRAVRDGQLSIATRATRGTFTAVMVPAMNPQGVPDPLVTKTGSWSVAAGQRVSARSGQPRQPEPRPQRERHWVAVELVDDDERPLAGGRVAITTPDGVRHERTLNAKGTTRVDGIGQAGECRVELLHIPLPPLRREDPKHWVAIDCVDEAGNPIANQRVAITTPDGQRLVRTTNAKGSVRVDGIGEAGECLVERCRDSTE